MVYTDLKSLEYILKTEKFNFCRYQSRKIWNIHIQKKNIEVFIFYFRLYGILTINAFEIPNASSEANLASIYATGCLPEHHCVPTCHRSFGSDLSITLRAAVPLDTNQRISITYTDSLWPTLDRRAHLAYSKHFLCDCTRCIDPTELGTVMSKVLFLFKN